jgi:hypothetical protein
MAPEIPVQGVVGLPITIELDIEEEEDVNAGDSDSEE